MLEDSEQYPLDLGHNAQHRVHTHAYQHKNPSYVKHSGGGVMIVACFATIGATGAGYLAVVQLSVNSFLYHSILESNVRPSVHEIKLA